MPVISCLPHDSGGIVYICGCVQKGGEGGSHPKIIV